MTEYECKRCSYKTIDKRNFIRHLSRTNPCRPLHNDIPLRSLLDEILTPNIEGEQEVYECQFCNRIFSSRSGRYKHEKKCAQSYMYLAIQEQNEILKRQYDTIVQQLSSPSASNILINNTQNVQTNNNVVININSFGQERISHIIDDKEFLTTCLMGKSISRLIENIYCDKEHPENRNVRIKNRNDKLAEIHMDGEWVVIDQNEALQTLLDKGYTILKIHSRRPKETIMEEWGDDDPESLEDAINWIDRVGRDDEKTTRPLLRDILILLIKNKSYILGK
jgi:uncharacterized C2H2 Zn-finger protein